jgi:hypothetical protein
VKSLKDDGKHFGPSIDNSGMIYQDSQFKTAIMELLDTFIQFRLWIDRQKKINVAFMKSYKKQMETDVSPKIKQLKKKYQNREEGQSASYRLILKGFTCFERPITFMQTQLRPSVGMGVFLERWMLTRAVQDYLKECCQDADRYLEQLTKKMEL